MVYCPTGQVMQGKVSIVPFSNIIFLVLFSQELNSISEWTKDKNTKIEIYLNKKTFINNYNNINN